MIYKHLSVIAAAAAIVGLAGCNDLEEGFYVADGSDLVMTVTPDNANSADPTISEILAVGGSDIIRVDTKAPWKVQLMNDNRDDSQQDWTIILNDPVVNENESYFTFTSSTNFGAQRQWNNAFRIYIENHDESVLLQRFISVRQGIRSIIPTPTTFETFSPEGSYDNQIRVEANGAWTVSCDQEQTAERPEGWIELLRPESMNGDGTLRLNVLANRATSPRQATISFADGSGMVVAEVPIRQAEADVIFDVGPNSSLEYVVAAEGETLNLNVLSDASWRLDCAQAGAGGWLQIPQSALGASMGGNTGAGYDLPVTVLPNMALEERQAKLTFSRSDVGAITVTIRQIGALVAKETYALSRPWLEGTYTQDYVTLRAVFTAVNSPDERGIAFRPKGAADWSYVPNLSGTAEEEKEGRIGVRLNSEGSYSTAIPGTSGAGQGTNTYRGGTEYEVAAYLRFGSELKMGETTVFTSPGVLPGSGDQPAPAL